MKKLLYFTLAAIFISCSNPTLPDTPTTTTITTTADTTTTSPIMASYDGETVKTYDGTTWTEYATGTAHNIGSGWISVYDTAYNTQTGEAYKLSCTPSHIILSGTDFYYTANGVVYRNREQINDFGLIPADDIRIFKTGIFILQDRWWKNVFTGESHFYTIGDNLADVTDPYISIYNSISADGPYDWIGYMQSAYKWTEYNGKYYSDNGSIYIPGIKLQNAQTSLYGFTPDGGTYFDTWTDAAVPYYIGKYIENSTDYLIFLDLTKGYIYKFSPELNTMYQSGPIISGYGTYTTARNAGNSFWHIQNSSKIYFPFNGSIYVYDPSNGSVNVFLVGNFVLWNLE